MKKNIHPNERAARIAIGVGLIAFAIMKPGNPWFYLGVIPLATGLIGWCPPYALLGIDTCKLGKKKE